MTDDERRNALRGARDRLYDAICATRSVAHRHREVPLPVATGMLALANLTLFIAILSGDGPLSRAETLVDWGANFGPRTTNGEWWRLASAPFVHGGPLHLVATLAGLVPIALLLEPVIGPLAIVMSYLSAGMLASLISLWGAAVEPNVGASGALFGLYGVTIATWIAGPLRPAVRWIHWNVWRYLLASAAVFFVYSLTTEWLVTAAEITALIAGFATGIMLARHAHEGKPGTRRVAAVAARVAAVTVLFAVPVRGIADVRPNLERVIEMERRTAGAYEARVTKSRGSDIPTKALAELIDRKILPELRAARARLAALGRVPQKHRALVVVAEEYLRLRDDSWVARKRALDAGSMDGLQQADRLEWKALAAFEAILGAAPR